MANKVIIGILVFLLLLTGAIGGYCYNLKKEIVALTQQLSVFQEQLSVFQEEEAARIDALGRELTTFEGETTSRIEAVSKGLDKVAAEFEQSRMDARAIYQRVSEVIVGVSDGQKIVGTGFVFNAEGYIVTPYHVVQDKDEIDVILSDGTVLVATVFGSSQLSDVAILAAREALSIEPLTLADSTTVKVGEPVAVVGNPLGLAATMTTGIVSQTNRYVEIRYDSESRWVANLVQFDAAVNFGNSGSPLLNSKGEVIGMVVGRVDPGLGEGIYYAVSSNKVRRVSDSIIKRGYFDYPWLGVEITNLISETVLARGLKTGNGALVTAVMPGAPAEAAGVRVDDIIVSINGVVVREAADLTGYIGEYASPDEVVTVELIRGVTRLALPVKVGKRSE